MLLRRLKVGSVAFFAGANLLVLSTALVFPGTGVASAPTCNGVAATIYVEGGIVVGSSSDGVTYSGTLNGTAAADVIVGTSGNDQISGQDGADTICGGAGNDSVNGGAGGDWIAGEDGDDALDGGAGTDILLGGNGADRLLGADGGDTMTGGGGDDFCDQGDGRDGQECEVENNEGMLVITKDAVPNDGKDFSFTGTNGLGTFSLDDDTDATLSNQKSFQHVAVGTYVITEAAAANGWTTSNIVCSTGGTADIAGAKATVNITEGSTVTCTFTNTKAIYQCNDGTDNDQDGVTDRSDPGCWTDPKNPKTYVATDNDEATATTQCQDQKDNDGDGLIDLKDPECVNAQDNSEVREKITQCNDGKDNDADGLIDAKDPGCWMNSTDPDTYNPKDESEKDSDVMCPHFDFPGAPGKFLAKLQLNHPELYARVIAVLEARRGKWVNLCQKHPQIYKKIIDRRNEHAARKDESRQDKEEKKRGEDEDKADQEMDQESDQDQTDTAHSSSKVNLKADLKAKGRPFLGLGKYW